MKTYHKPNEQQLPKLNKKYDKIHKAQTAQKK